MKLVKLELISRPDEIYLGKIYSKESYNKAKRNFINTNRIFSLIDLNKINVKHWFVDHIIEKNAIGTIIKWEDYYIEVNIKDDYYDKYDWKKCKAGIWYMTNLIAGDENHEIIKSDISEVIGFQILTPLDIEAINRENNKYK